MTDLDSLKRDIDLNAFVVAHGFKELLHDRWAGHLAYRRGKGERIYVSPKSFGRFFWCPSSAEKGSVIDFLKVFEGMTTRGAIDELKAWAGQPVVRAFKTTAVEAATPKNLDAVADAIEDMKPVKSSLYLQEARGIPQIVLQSWRFAGRILEDSRGNIVFPHSNGKQWCGGEVRNYRYKGFMKSGERGIALSKASPLDKRLLLTEGLLDSLAWCAMYDDGRTRYGSFGGTPGAAQTKLLQNEIYRMSPDSEIVWAGDADAAGERAAQFVKAACEVALQNGAYLRMSPRPDKDFDAKLLRSRAARRSALIPA
jgi:hypothetical protein